MSVVEAAYAQAPLAIDVDVDVSVGHDDACDDCKAQVLPLQRLVKSEPAKAFFNDLAKRICIGLELFAPYICNGTVDIFTNVRVVL